MSNGQGPAAKGVAHKINFNNFSICINNCPDAFDLHEIPKKFVNPQSVQKDCSMLLITKIAFNPSFFPYK